MLQKRGKRSGKSPSVDLHDRLIAPVHLCQKDLRFVLIAVADLDGIGPRQPAQRIEIEQPLPQITPAHTDDTAIPGEDPPPEPDPKIIHEQHIAAQVHQDQYPDHRLSSLLRIMVDNLLQPLFQCRHAGFHLLRHPKFFKCIDIEIHLP